MNERAVEEYVEAENAKRTRKSLKKMLKGLNKQIDNVNDGVLFDLNQDGSLTQKKRDK